MHIDARDETLSQTFCFIIGYPRIMVLGFVYAVDSTLSGSRTPYRYLKKEGYFRYRKDQF